MMCTGHNILWVLSFQVMYGSVHSMQTGVSRLRCCTGLPSMITIILPPQVWPDGGASLNLTKYLYCVTISPFVVWPDSFIELPTRLPGSPLYSSLRCVSLEACISLRKMLYHSFWCVYIRTGPVWSEFHLSFDCKVISNFSLLAATSYFYMTGCQHHCWTESSFCFCF